MTSNVSHRLSFTVPFRVVQAFSDAVEAVTDAPVSLFEATPDVTDIESHPEDLWKVETFLPSDDIAEIQQRLTVLARAHGIEPPALSITPFHDPGDWQAQVEAQSPPLQVGRFFVYGRHYQGAVPPATLPLLVDAATAFGSGDHPTTAGCLAMLDRVARYSPRPRHTLDMGCGSGILAMAMARLWQRPVTAVDIDPEAVRVTRFNAQRNHLAPLIRSSAGPGYTTPLVRQSMRRRGLFDVITANILARPLIHMAPQAGKTLAPGGHLILSGLLAKQVNAVCSAHCAASLALKYIYKNGPWRVLLLRKSS